MIKASRKVTEDDRKMLENYLIKNNLSLFKLALELNVSEYSLYKFRNNYLITDKMYNKIIHGIKL